MQNYGHVSICLSDKTTTTTLFTFLKKNIIYFVMICFITKIKQIITKYMIIFLKSV
jgi:hypothetical protein